MTQTFGKLYQSRQLLANWTLREFRIRYSQAALGIAWSILQPTAMMVITTIVFSTLLRLPTHDVPYPLYVYSGILAWNFFAGGLSTSFSTVADNMALVSKVAFPREVLPLSSILVSLIDFVIASSVFVLLLAYYQIQLGWMVLLVPVVVLVQMALITGISLLVATVHVRYRDIRFIVPLVLQILFFATPIFYSTESIPKAYQKFFLLNPIANIIEAYRGIIFFNKLPSEAAMAYTIAIALVVLALGYGFFKRNEGKFADLG